MAQQQLPCPMDGCTGTVTAQISRRVGGEGAIVQYLDDVPLVECSAGCSNAYELEGPVNEKLASLRF